MSSSQPSPLSIDGQGLRFAVVAARFNQDLVDGLLKQVLHTLTKAGVDPEDIEILRVPGSFETSYVAQMIASIGEVDCIVCLGVILAGETLHDEVLAHSTAESLLGISRDCEIPVINGIIAAENRAQAEERCLGSKNRGREFGQAALEMAELKLILEERLASADRDDLFGEKDELDLEEDALDSEEDDETSSRDPWKS